MNNRPSFLVGGLRTLDINAADSLIPIDFGVFTSFPFIIDANVFLRNEVASLFIFKVLEIHLREWIGPVGGLFDCLQFYEKIIVQFRIRAMFIFIKLNECCRGDIFQLKSGGTIVFTMLAT
ncbi:hypothetical protein C1X61_09415 [Pseudomonas sp. FW215-T2]|nr:hypothetical protein C1X61_09415 [Pseudomonas sp. FW215-T2]PNA12513.1 hypothetical protein C1X62_12350 [Pseudomonas sp. FW215-R3]PNB32525.1 hypothetical protein C1X63_29700 [Pseudomonas sp. FW305-131]